MVKVPTVWLHTVPGSWVRETVLNATCSTRCWAVNTGFLNCKPTHFRIWPPSRHSTSHRNITAGEPALSWGSPRCLPCLKSCLAPIVTSPYSYFHHLCSCAKPTCLLMSFLLESFRFYIFYWGSNFSIKILSKQAACQNSYWFPVIPPTEPEEIQPGYSYVERTSLGITWMGDGEAACLPVCGLPRLISSIPAISGPWPQSQSKPWAPMDCFLSEHQ